MNWFNVVVYFSCHCIVDVRNSSLSFLSWVMFLESIHPVSIINTGITCMKWMANQIYISQICVSFVRVWLFIITSGSWLYYIGIDFLRNILELSQDSLEKVADLSFPESHQTYQLSMSHSEVRDLVLLPSAAIFITYVDLYKLVILSSLGKHLLYEGHLHYNNLKNPPPNIIR